LDRSGVTYLFRLGLAMSLSVLAACPSEPPSAPATPAAEADPTAGSSAVSVPPRCVAVATASVEEGAAPLQVVFSAEGICTHGAATFEWDFGDGSPRVEGAMVAHVYSQPGEYEAYVIVRDAAHGAEDSDDATITVREP
jgi:PKD repeat protein